MALCGEQGGVEISNMVRPVRIILVRHGESEGNVDRSKYTTVADSKIPLTHLGMQQAQNCGHIIRSIIEADVPRCHAVLTAPRNWHKNKIENKSVNEDGNGKEAGGHWQVYFYVSPYERTRGTLRGIGRAFARSRILGVREEPRLREQDFGNFQEEQHMKTLQEIRDQYGRFCYRFPEGESGADVFDRVTSFLESLWRDIETNRLNHHHCPDMNLVIVSHGVTMRIFLMRWFKWTTEQFELLNNPGNCEVRVMQLGSGGEYSLAVHHSREEMAQWGLSSEMIADQEWRATAQRGVWNSNWPWSGTAFFDHFEDDVQKESDSDDSAVP